MVEEQKISYLTVAVSFPHKLKCFLGSEKSENAPLDYPAILASVKVSKEVIQHPTEMI